MMNRIRAAAAVALLLIVTSCAFHSTARDWNGRLGPKGKPVYYQTTTKVGLKLLIVLPFLGDMSVDGLVDDLTQRVADEDGDSVRIVQGSSEAYWYGWPPFTWIITPIVSEVTAEYEPSEEQIALDQADREDGEGEEDSDGDAD